MRPARLLAGVALVAALLPGCGDDDVAPADDAAPAERPAPGADGVAACDDLRRRENELIRIANEALDRLGDATDDAARLEAVSGGFDRLVEAARTQEVGDVEPEVRDALVAGAEAAAAELEDERRLLLEQRGGGISAADERGVAGELQTAIEKAFSNLEPPRAVYREAGLDQATDDDPDCRFVTQRADPAA